MNIEETKIAATSAWRVLRVMFVFLWSVTAHLARERKLWLSFYWESSQWFFIKSTKNRPPQNKSEMAFRSLLLTFRPATIFYLLKPRRKASMRSKELRHVLKLALRRHGLRCISVEQGSGYAIRATSI
jgi:hypothetical protein